MIDLHNHILPGVDDGAQSIEESREMGRAFASYGVGTICVTPHIIEWSKVRDVTDIRERVESLQRDFDREGIGVKLLVGGEAHLTPTLAHEVRAGRVPTLNGSSYLLLEFPYDHLPPFYEQVIFELQVAGIVPIVAHPERISPILENPNVLFQLVKRGCLGQLTAMSLVGGFGGKIRGVSQSMLAHDMIHLIASDAHNADPNGRMSALAGVFQAASRIVGEAAAQALLRDTPAKIVAGETVQPIPPKEYRKTRFGLLGLRA